MPYTETGEVDWNAALLKHRAPTTWREGDDPQTIDFCIGAWINSVHFESLPAETQLNYRRHLVPVAAWSKTAGHPNVCTITQYDVEDFLRTFNDRPYLKVQVKSQLRRVMDVPIKMGWRWDNPVLEVPVEPPESNVTLWTLEDVELYVGAALKNGQRSLAGIILTVWETGHRLRDVCRFQKGVQFADGRLRFWNGKTKKWVSVPISKELSAYLSGIDTSYLFPFERTGLPYAKHQLSQDFGKLRKSVPGADEHYLKISGLRHSYIVESFVAGGEPQEVASVSGHAYSTMWTLFELYAPSDSRFAESMQLKRGFIKAEVAPLSEEDQADRRRRMVQQVQRLKAITPKRRRNSFRT